MKKIFALTLALLMALMALAGCGRSDLIASLDPTGAPEDTPTEAPVIKPAETGSVRPAGDFAVAAPDKAEYPVNPDSAVNSDGSVNWDEYDALYSKWMAAVKERRESAGNAPDMNAFLKGLTKELLIAKEGGNIAFSPANIYIALAMLAEVTDGNTRAEILSVLGSPDIEALRTQTAALLSAESWDDGAEKCLLANSIWMNKDIIYNADTLKRIAEVYGASSFSGDPALEEYSQALCQWLDENTGGLLKDAIDGTRFTPEMVLAIASTIYFKDSWNIEFDKNRTYEDVFHAQSGDITCDFMHKTIMEGLVFRGENYTALKESFKSGEGSMYMLLPDEGVSVAEMLSGGALDGFGVRGADLGSDWREMTVKLSVPKLDISSKFDLVNMLKNMGMHDCFNYTVSDFTPLTDLPELYVDEITHAARVKTDEEGIEAAAYTLIMVKANGMFMEHDEIELNFNRPFAFVVTGLTGAPLFVGVVNTPKN